MKVYIIDTSSILEQGFIVVLEKLVSDNVSLRFYIDLSVEKEATNFKSINKDLNANTIKNVTEYLKSFGTTTEIDSNNLYNTKPIETLLKDKTLDITLITQRENIFNMYIGFLSPKFSITKIENARLVVWPEKKKTITEAFYVENDIYVNPVDTDSLDIEYVFSPKYGYLKLDKSYHIGGGEGTCYRSYNGLFIKIYKTKHISYANYKKLQTMIKCDIGNPFIIWPKDIVYYKGDFVGYVMQELKDVKSVDELRDSNFPGFSPHDRFVLCRDFLKLVQYLHEKDILVGDMKFDNIVVDKNKRVYLIDTGSFQIADYSCAVFNREFTAKDYHGNDLKINLRSFEDEFYPINKIIFEILMLKNPFYSEDNISIDVDKPQKFNFSLDKPRLDVMPPLHIVMWYNLSKNMREAFYYYFKERKICALKDWIKELDNYIIKIQKRR